MLRDWIIEDPLRLGWLILGVWFLVTVVHMIVLDVRHSLRTRKQRRISSLPPTHTKTGLTGRVHRND